MNHLSKCRAGGNIIDSSASSQRPELGFEHYLIDMEQKVTQTGVGDKLSLEIIPWEKGIVATIKIQ
jgi:hypothetical protein